VVRSYVGCVGLNILSTSDARAKTIDLRRLRTRGHITSSGMDFLSSRVKRSLRLTRLRRVWSMVITRFADDKTRKAADENVSLVAAEQKRARQTFTLTEEHVSRLAE